MYKVTETYKDYNGVERTEDFYFNLDEDELTKLQLSEYGGLSEMLNTLIQKKDITKMINIFELIIDKSYGVRSGDGRNFYKADMKPDILIDFKSTRAYSQIFTRFSTDATFAAEFIKGVIPEDIAKRVEEMQNNGELAEIVQMPTAPATN